MRGRLPTGAGSNHATFRFLNVFYKVFFFLKCGTLKMTKKNGYLNYLYLPLF